ncbi:MAG TPA: SDR family NAD(P)-dependent oxidoreductase [Candidatus Angelobacter sp.]|nr:SDR family NAD(P)-dependent oxidoreductase [Candidatus Angelobacter sp.]
MKELRGAVAVITGAASGIGRALATELASAGAQLALADVSAAGLEETRRLLGSAAARTYTVDVGDPAAVEAFAAKVGEDFGRVSLLINNAGVALHGTFAEVSLKDMEWLLRINYWGVVYGCKLFMPLLQREPEAHIVNVSSVFGLIGPPGQTAYASSKFAVRGFTEALRYELQGTNIHVSCVHPGGISTAIADNARLGEKANAQEAAKLKARFKKITPTTPEEAARVIVKGILNNKPRILIGSDARRIDAIQRLVPIRGVSALVSMMAKRAPAGAKKPS